MSKRIIPRIQPYIYQKKFFISKPLIQPRPLIFKPFPIRRFSEDNKNNDKDKKWLNKYKKQHFNGFKFEVSENTLFYTLLFVTIIIILF